MVNDGTNQWSRKATKAPSSLEWNDCGKYRGNDNLTGWHMPPITFFTRLVLLPFLGHLTRNFVRSLHTPRSMVQFCRFLHQDIHLMNAIPPPTFPSFSLYLSLRSAVKYIPSRSFYLTIPLHQQQLPISVSLYLILQFLTTSTFLNSKST